MSITGFQFFIFLAVTTGLYFAVPKKNRWIVLLAAGLIFYAATGPVNLIYLAVTAFSTYGAAILVENLRVRSKAYLKEHKKEFDREQRKAVKRRDQRRQRLIVAAAMILNFGLLIYFKYLNFIIEQINRFLSEGGRITSVQLLVPLGISFYTFVSTGYLADVYWEKTPAQKNPLKMLLFTSFFPQITQGPISNYRVLAEQLYEGHDFEYTRFAWGIQRFIWGLIKKIAIADTIGVWMQEIFIDYWRYPGITVLIGAFCYSIQIYADFSGYMDMMCGLCEILGIKLEENFERPYFSKSVAEYWRRWHITLGRWFKDYIYYPIAVSKFSRKLGKAVQKKFGRKVAKNLPATFALVITWLATGLWHGASWKYILWGGVNGFFIILTLWLEPVYKGAVKALHIREDAFYWRAFQVIRTFLLVTLIKVLPEVGTLKDGLKFIGRIFTSHRIPASIGELFSFLHEWQHFLVVAVLTAVLFICSLIQRRRPVRTYFNRLPWAVRVIVLAGAFVCAYAFGSSALGGFMYVKF